MTSALSQTQPGRDLSRGPFFLKQAEGALEVIQAGRLVASLPETTRLPITGGDGSRKKGRGHRAAMFELPYLDGVQHVAWPQDVQP